MIHSSPVQPDPTYLPTPYPTSTRLRKKVLNE